MKDVFKYFLLFAAYVIFATPLTAKEPENLHTAKHAGIFYHDSGQYDVDREKVAQEAISFLNSKISENNALIEPRKLAVVFDIDETSLSNYEILLSLDFAFVASLLKPELEKAKDPAVRPTLKLYQFAIENGVAIFFITGRSETLRAVTEKNLKKVGYTEWMKLFMKPDDYDKDSVIPYKSASRKSIEDGGYFIIVNIGDQWSDLAGGYSERTFKLPNPYYYVP
jgi:acid phosphatase